MFRAAVVLALASVLLAALALISCLSVEDKREIRGLPRFAWVLVILLAPLIGPIAWFTTGRPRSSGRQRSPWRAATGLPEPRRPQAPDDDPDFLRSLDQRRPGSSGRPGSAPPAPEGSEEELLRRWEEDLDRHDDEQRRGAEGRAREEERKRREEERRRSEGTET